MFSGSWTSVGHIQKVTRSGTTGRDILSRIFFTPSIFPSFTVIVSTLQRRPYVDPSSFLKLLVDEIFGLFRSSTLMTPNSYEGPLEDIQWLRLSKYGFGRWSIKRHNFKNDKSYGSYRVQKDRLETMKSFTRMVLSKSRRRHSFFRSRQWRVTGIFFCLGQWVLCM